ncbi:potassium channel protein [Micromonospora sp. NBC_01796]|uniref:potassium channel protein n=1 Tax=Micromonospora sp. NBC_01796 TaxID=2975987 RepID=UPI002DDA9FD8|nr:NAD-binding protein [Micromonospora sp. NBC_01796]WSA85445.1 NAD-binding protein [Micromonospora sp. NBC_01796]
MSGDPPPAVEPSGTGAPPEPAGPARAGHFVVWGDNPLARRLVAELMDTYHAPVTVILGSMSAGQAPDIAGLRPENGDPALRPVVVVAPRLSQEVLRHAGVEHAAALALVGRDDIENVDAAMMAREVSPTVRIVVRIFNPVLGEGVAAMLGDCEVLSGSEIAAPAFVAAALGDDTPRYVRLPDELLMAVNRDRVADPDDILCGLAVTGGQAGPVTLPERDGDADLVLARVTGPRPRPVKRRRRRPLRTTRLLLDRKLRLALGSVAGLLLVGTGTLTVLRDLSFWQAAYLTAVTALGGADADLTGSAGEQVVQLVLVLAGVALIPTVTVLLVGLVVNVRLALAAGVLTEPISGHVVVVGLGNIGTRVVEELHALGIGVVAIDRTADARGVQVARDLDIPVLIRNANSAETLRAASVQTCRALVVLCADDVTNLETALLARSVHRADQDRGGPVADPRPPLRVVLRLFDEEFAGRIRRSFGINISRSVSYLAAPAFAAALLGREVIDTVSVGRRVLLVAEIPVGAGSALEGEFCPEVSRPHEVRLIAVRTGRVGQTLWSLPDRRPLVRTDRLLVVATRAGLAALLTRTAASANPPPLVEPKPLPLLARRPDRPA